MTAMIPSLYGKLNAQVSGFGSDNNLRNNGLKNIYQWFPFQHCGHNLFPDFEMKCFRSGDIVSIDKMTISRHGKTYSEDKRATLVARAIHINTTRLLLSSSFLPRARNIE